MLVCLVGPAAAPTADADAATTEGTTTPAQAETAVAPSAEPSESPTPSERRAPVSEVIDPWADVPLQSVVPGRAVTIVRSAPPPATERSPDLMDPWARAPRRSVPRRLPSTGRAPTDLRDPFGGASQSIGPRLAQAELRNPFERRPAAVTEDASSTRSAPRPPGPLPTTEHPDLRNPFAEPPSPPPRACDQGPCAPSLPPAVAPEPPASPEPAPRSGWLPGGASPLATT